MKIADRIEMLELSMEAMGLNKFNQYDIRTVICYHGGVYNKNVNQSISELVKI